MRASHDPGGSRRLSNGGSARISLKNKRLPRDPPKKILVKIRPAIEQNVHRLFLDLSRERGQARADLIEEPHFASSVIPSMFHLTVGESRRVRKIVPQRVRNAEQDIRHLHRATLMRDHDQLRIVAQLVDIGDETTQVGIIKRRLDLVEDVNGVERVRYTANRRASAVSDFSPPDMSIIFVMRLPAGCAFTSTPVFSRSSGIDQRQTRRTAGEQRREYLLK